MRLPDVNTFRNVFYQHLLLYRIENLMLVLLNFCDDVLYIFDDELFSTAYDCKTRVE